MYQTVVTTAIFATCEVGIISFVISAMVSLPKQLVLVYVGVAYEKDGSGDESTTSRAVSAVVAVVAALITIIALRWIRIQMMLVKGPLVYRRRKER